MHFPNSISHSIRLHSSAHTLNSYTTRSYLFCLFVSELLSNVAVEGEEDSTEAEDAPSVSMTTTSTAYSLIEMSHPVFRPVKKLWNSHVDSHREVGGGYMVNNYVDNFFDFSFLYVQICAVLAAASEVCPLCISISCMTFALTWNCRLSRPTVAKRARRNTLECWWVWVGSGGRGQA